MSNTNGTSNSLISLQDVTHSFERKLVLSEITHSFSKNKLIAILGKSGSGKTTLLQIINGMIRPNGGSVQLFETPINYDQVHQVRLQIGYVVQQAGLFPHMSIESNISLLGKITHETQASVNTRINRLLEMVQLPQSYRAKYPHQLSGGEQQRVGLCRAMFLNPPILLMDEPFASLDFETKHSIYEHLRTIQENEPRTILLVTHDWEEALTLADRFVWLKNGVLKESGDKMALEKLKLTYMNDL